MVSRPLDHLLLVSGSRLADGHERFLRQTIPNTALRVCKRHIRPQQFKVGAQVMMHLA